MTTKKKKIKCKNKTLKKEKYYKAVCVFHKNPYNVTGVVEFSQRKNSKKVRVKYNIKNLKNGLHGFHIHNFGDLRDECHSACAHFNPYNKNHGGRISKERHVGDLGNLLCKNNKCVGSFYDSYISLKPGHKCNIVGRSVIIHEDEDDLGMGNNDESLKTGNAGKRLACGVVGLTNN